jgi:hypothetical protein
MRIEFEDNDLAPLIERVVVRVLDQREADDAKLADRLAYSEAEAAALLGVRRHVLRDARLRRELDGAKVGKRIMYTREELLRFLGRQPANG